MKEAQPWRRWSFPLLHVFLGCRERLRRALEVLSSPLQCEIEGRKGSPRANILFGAEESHREEVCGREGTPCVPTTVRAKVAGRWTSVATDVQAVHVTFYRPTAFARGRSGNARRAFPSRGGYWFLIS